MGTVRFLDAIPDGEPVSVALDVLTDMLLHSRFDETEIEKEKGVILEEMNVYLDTPQRYVGNIYDRLLFGDQPLGWDILGTRETIESTTRDTFTSYLERWYWPERIVVGVGGRVGDGLVERLEELLKEIETLQTELEVSEVGFGLWTLASGRWGEFTEDQAVDLLRKAYDAGINYYDVSPLDGNGLGERVLGKAFADKRELVIFSTKVGLTDGRRDFSPAAIRKSVDESLARLGTTYIDALQLHYPDAAAVADPMDCFDDVHVLPPPAAARAGPPADRGPHGRRRRPTIPSNCPARPCSMTPASRAWPQGWRPATAGPAGQRCGCAGPPGCRRGTCARGSPRGPAQGTYAGGRND